MKPLHTRSARNQRGISLIEALIAFAIMSLSMLAVLGLQMNLRYHSELARQKTEALLLAQEDIEHVRAFSVLDTAPGKQAYADISGQAGVHAAGLATHTDYLVSRDVAAGPDFKDVQLTVSWTDRRSEKRSVTLGSMIAGIPPAAAAALSILPSGPQSAFPQRRHPRLPLVARDLGNGKSVLKPADTVVWVFDNATGLLTGRCVVEASKTAASLTAADVQDCSANAQGFPVSGFVRFATGDTVTAADAAHPSGRTMDLGMVIDGLGGKTASGAGVSASYECFDDTASTASAVTYRCVVFADRLATWSGKLMVLPVGWSLGVTANDFKLCRYSTDHDGDGKISNIEHPRAYADVDGPLAHQNFLVIKGSNACPAETTGNRDVAGNTLQQDPAGVD